MTVFCISVTSDTSQTALFHRPKMASEFTKNNFLIKSLCVVDQYQNFPITSLQQNDPNNLNGILTFKENFADIIGLQIGFKSFVENFHPNEIIPHHFTKEQIFFIASAQVN